MSPPPLSSTSPTTGVLPPFLRLVFPCTHHFTTVHCHASPARFDGLSQSLSSFVTQTTDQFSSVENGKATKDELATELAKKASNDRCVAWLRRQTHACPHVYRFLAMVLFCTVLRSARPRLNSPPRRVDALEDALTLAWPALESFDSESPTGWTDQNSNAYASVTSCGPYGSLLGGFNVAGRGLRLSKTYTVGIVGKGKENSASGTRHRPPRSRVPQPPSISSVHPFQLPVHSGVQIEFDYFFIDSWDNEFARVLVDNELQWSRRHNHAGAGKSGQLCGNPASANWGDTVEHVVLRLEEHTARSLRLTVTASLDGLADDECVSCAMTSISRRPRSPVPAAQLTLGSHSPAVQILWH